MSLQVKQPEKRKRSTKSSSQPLSSPPPSFSLLPNEIIVSCLARISRSYYPTLSAVSKSFCSLLSSTELYAARSHLGSTKQCLYVCLVDFLRTNPQLFMLWDNPNRTLPNSFVTKNKKKPFNYPLQSSSVVAVGYEIYVIGGVKGAPSSAMRVLDCRSHTWRDGPSMNVARENVLSCVYDGKIYVVGRHRGFEDGVNKELEGDETWAQVFDTKTQTWGRLPDRGNPIRNFRIYMIEEMEGKINFWNIHKIYFTYDTKQGKWERCKSESAKFPLSQCVIENVLYRYGSQCLCQWYDIKEGVWKEVKGLDSLQNKYQRNGGSFLSNRKVVSFGGKLILIWKANTLDKIWCAVILLEKRDGGEVWGNVEWVDVVRTFPSSCYLSHCLTVSI